MRASSLEAVTDLTAEELAAYVLALWAYLEDGTLSKEEFIESASVRIFAAKTITAIGAARAVLSWMLAHEADPDSLQVAPVPAPEESDRLADALDTILTEAEEAQAALEAEIEHSQDVAEKAQGLKEQTQNRLKRLADAEVRQSAKDGTQDSLVQAGVTHWKWNARPDACDRCAERNGKVYSIKLKFRDHPGCHCKMEPIPPKKKVKTR